MTQATRPGFLVIISEHSGQVVEETMDNLEFIARVTSQISDKGHVLVRYYGLYANAHRGKVRKTVVSPLVLRMSKEDQKPLPYKGWAAMVRKVRSAFFEAIFLFLTSAPAGNILLLLWEESISSFLGFLVAMSWSA